MEHVKLESTCNSLPLSTGSDPCGSPEWQKRLISAPSKDCGSQIPFATNMANTTVNVGKTAASRATAAMDMVNSDTAMGCHEPADTRTTSGPRHLQPVLQGNAARWQRSSRSDCGKVQRIYRGRGLART